ATTRTRTTCARCTPTACRCRPDGRCSGTSPSDQRLRRDDDRIRLRRVRRDRETADAAVVARADGADDGPAVDLDPVAALILDHEGPRATRPEVEVHAVSPVDGC